MKETTEILRLNRKTKEMNRTINGNRINRRKIDSDTRINRNTRTLIKEQKD